MSANTQSALLLIALIGLLGLMFYLGPNPQTKIKKIAFNPGVPQTSVTPEIPKLSGSWKIIRFKINGVEKEVPSHPQAFSFSNGSLGGTICNHMGGTYTIDQSNTLKAADLMMTEMYCGAPNVMENETGFTKLLTSGAKISYEGNLLILENQEEQIKYTLTPAY